MTYIRPPRIQALARASALLTLVVCALAPASAYADTVLSDEFSFNRSAGAVTQGRIRALPNDASRLVDRLHFQTEDGYSEVYLVLRSRVAADGREWMKIRIPGRPNGRVGWVPRASLGPLRTSYKHLLVNRAAARATLYHRGKRIWSFRVGTGAPSTPTPAGRFWIREKFRVPRSGTIYGPYAFGTANYSVLTEWPGGGVVGIHGTNQPGLIPGRPSHGCIRVRNGDITRLFRMLPVGASLRVI